MEDSLISVIVPVYNVETYLSACLDSIMSQNYNRLEIIVINDGSEDLSLKIAETYREKDDRIKVYTFSNEGLSAARNHGLSLATGDYVTFVDSDDILLPGALKTMLDISVKKDADIVEGTVVRGLIQGNIESQPNFKVLTYTPHEAIEDVLYQKRLLPSACGKLFKKELFYEIRFTPGILYEDLDIFYKLFEQSRRIVWIDVPVYFYRENEGSIINTWKPERLDVLKVTENLENYIREKYPHLISSARDRRLSANFNMYALCSINGDKTNAIKCWNQIKQYRRESLFNSKVRIKNKTGILLSYLGKNMFKMIARRVYR